MFRLSKRRVISFFFLCFIFLMLWLLTNPNSGLIFPASFTEKMLVDANDFTPLFSSNPETLKALRTINTDFHINKEKYFSLENPMGDPLPGTYQRPVSVVIVHFNEEFLNKTVRSVLQATSEHLINEVLIVDDTSELPVAYSWFPKDRRIRIIRAKKRLGLINSRNCGGFNAQGPIMVLIDAHVKPRDNWLVSLTRGLYQSHKRIMALNVGCLNGTRWVEETPKCAPMHKAGFKWNLGHIWEPEMSRNEIMKLSGLSEEESDPDYSPITMGMFGTTKDWWLTINGMDTGLEVWGGENIEVSLRTWLCGGDIKVARESFVDHAFRPHAPYHLTWEIIWRNQVRIAEAWLDEPSIARFYQALKKPRGSIEFGNIDEVKKLQKKLNCHDFQWYIRRFKNRSPVTKASYEKDSDAV